MSRSGICICTLPIVTAPGLFSGNSASAAVALEWATTANTSVTTSSRPAISLRHIPSLHLHNPRVVVRNRRPYNPVTHDHTNGTHRNGSKRKPPPDIVIPHDLAVRNVHPTAAGPVLHIEARNA